MYNKKSDIWKKICELGEEMKGQIMWQIKKEKRKTEFMNGCWEQKKMAQRTVNKCKVEKPKKRRRAEWKAYKTVQ